MRRKRGRGAVVAWVVVGLLAAAGLVLVGRWSVPLDERPGFAAPEAMPVVVSPRVGPVTDVVALNAQVQHRGATTVTLLADQPDSFRQAITAAPLKAGDEVRVGDLLGEINGVPVFAMSGRVPSFRVMYAGDRGVDVEQLAASLVKLGYLRSGAKSVTEPVLVAVERFLTDEGYPELGGAVAKHGIDGRLFAFLPVLPVVVADSEVAVGAVVSDGAAPALTLVDGDAELVVAPPRAGVELPAGIAVSATCGSRTLTGELTDDRAPWVASQAEGEGETTPGEGWVVDTRDDLDAALGASCAATAAVVHGDDETVWVPASALYSAADGTTQVRVQTEGAVFEALAVETGAPAGGWVPVVDPPSALTAATRLLAGDV